MFRVMWCAGSKSAKPLKYTSFGAACSEVEIDLLTGEKTVLRSDLYFDCGRSLNPAVDIGQVILCFFLSGGSFRFFLFIIFGLFKVFSSVFCNFAYMLKVLFSTTLMCLFANALLQTCSCS